MNKLTLLSALVLLLLGERLLPLTVEAESIPERFINVVGRREATVTTPNVSLGDIAEVSSARMIDDEAVIGLKKIPLEKSPKPGETLTLSASAILAQMRESGVDLNHVAYTLPRVVTVSRASRKLLLDEVKGAIDEYIKTSRRDMEIKEVRLDKEIHLLPGVAEIKAIPFGVSTSGKMGFTVSATVPPEPGVRFNVDATVEEWTHVPLARRPIGKGEVVGASDVMMARLNANSIPKDAALSEDRVVGLALSNDIPYGEFFRHGKLSTPVVIENGSRVTMVFRSDFLDATAKGTALEAGTLGQEIRVRNDSSKKVVSGKVKEAGLVEVVP